MSHTARLKCFGDFERCAEEGTLSLKMVLESEHGLLALMRSGKKTESFMYEVFTEIIAIAIGASPDSRIHRCVCLKFVTSLPVSVHVRIVGNVHVILQYMIKVVMEDHIYDMPSLLRVFVEFYFLTRNKEFLKVEGVSAFLTKLVTGAPSLAVDDFLVTIFEKQLIGLVQIVVRDDMPWHMLQLVESRQQNVCVMVRALRMVNALMSNVALMDNTKILSPEIALLFLRIAFVHENPEAKYFALDSLLKMMNSMDRRNPNSPELNVIMRVVDENIADLCRFVTGCPVFRREHVMACCLIELMIMPDCPVDANVVELLMQMTNRFFTDNICTIFHKAYMDLVTKLSEEKQFFVTYVQEAGLVARIIDFLDRGGLSSAQRCGFVTKLGFLVKAKIDAGLIEATTEWERLQRDFLDLKRPMYVIGKREKKASRLYDSGDECSEIEGLLLRDVRSGKV